MEMEWNLCLYCEHQKEAIQNDDWCINDKQIQFGGPIFLHSTTIEYNIWNVTFMYVDKKIQQILFQLKQLHFDLVGLIKWMMLVSKGRKTLITPIVHFAMQNDNTIKTITEMTKHT